MANENEVNVKFGAEESALKSGSQEAARDVKAFKDSAESDAGKVTSAWSNVTPLFKGVAEGARTELEIAGAASLGRFGAVAGEVVKGIRDQWDQLPAVFKRVAVGAGVLLATTALFVGAKRAADATSEWDIEVMKLGRSMGTTATQASIWATAAEANESSISEINAASRGLTTQLRTQEAAMNALGLVTRDGSGNFRDMNSLMTDAIAVVNRYKEGTDRNLAAQTLFGRGVQGNSEVLKINAEELKKVQEYAESVGATLTAEGVAAWEDYDAAIDDAGIAAQGLRNTLSTAVMPVLGELINVFNSLAPAAVVVLKGALGGLATVFWGVRNAVVIVGNAIWAMIQTTAEPLMGMFSALAMAVSGDFKGAADRLGQISDNIGTAWSNAMENMVESSRRTRDEIWNLFAETPTAKEDDGQSYKSDKEAKEARKLQVEAVREFAKSLEQQVDVLKKSRDEAEKVMKDYLKKSKEFYDDAKKIRQQGIEDAQQKALDSMDPDAKQRELRELVDKANTQATLKFYEALAAMNRGEADAAESSIKAAATIAERQKALAAQMDDGEESQKYSEKATEMLARAAEIQGKLMEGKAQEQAKKIETLDAAMKDLNTTLVETKTKIDNLSNEIQPVKIKADTTEIDAQIETLKQKLKDLNVNIVLNNGAAAAQERSRQLQQGTPTDVPQYAGGGLFRGIGTGTSDDNIIGISDQEYIMQNAAVRKFGVGFMDAINEGRLPKFANGGSPRGGPTIGALMNSARSNITHMGSFNFPGLGTYRLGGTQHEFERLKRDFNREALKRGSPS
jgi:hypothetical protein